MAALGTSANYDRSRGWDAGDWESGNNWGDEGNWQNSSRGSYAEGSRPDYDRSRGQIEENHSRGWEDRGGEDRGCDGRGWAWGDHGEVEENHSRGWKDRGWEDRGGATRRKGATRRSPKPPFVEAAQPALLNVAADEIQQELIVGGGWCRRLLLRLSMCHSGQRGSIVRSRIFRTLPRGGSVLEGTQCGFEMAPL